MNRNGKKAPGNRIRRLLRKKIRKQVIRAVIWADYNLDKLTRIVGGDLRRFSADVAMAVLIMMFIPIGISYAREAEAATNEYDIIDVAEGIKVVRPKAKEEEVNVVLNIEPFHGENIPVFEESEVEILPKIVIETETEAEAEAVESTEAETTAEETTAESTEAETTAEEATAKNTTAEDNGPGYVEEKKEETKPEKTSAQIYAEKLLSDGVINEQEAQWIIERNGSPENPYISASEDVIANAADVMYAECGVYISTKGMAVGKRALLLTGTALINRYNYPTLGSKGTLNEIINYSCRGSHAYASRTRRMVGSRSYAKDGFDFVYGWAKDLYTYGPIGPRTLIWQGPKQGVVYDKIGTEYFGLDANPPF